MTFSQRPISKDHGRLAELNGIDICAKRRINCRLMWGINGVLKVTGVSVLSGGTRFALLLLGADELAVGFVVANSNLSVFESTLLPGLLALGDGTAVAVARQARGRETDGKNGR